MSESPRCRANSLLLIAKHGEGGHSVPNMDQMADGSCDYPYRPLLTPGGQGEQHFTGSRRSLNTTPAIPIITTSHDSPLGEEPGLHRILRQRSNPENKSEKCSPSPCTALSPGSRRKSFFPGLGTKEKFAAVVTDSLRLNGAIGQFKQVQCTPCFLHSPSTCVKPFMLSYAS